MSRAALRRLELDDWLTIETMKAPRPRQELLRTAKRIVVKIGTAVLTRSDGTLDERLVRHLGNQIAALYGRGLDVTVVSSGAIGAGMATLDIAARPRTVPMLQATAAVGQPQLMRLFEQAFARRGLRAAQMLLTRSDFEHRARYLNIRNTIAAVRELHAILIINENDTVAVDEIRFGDNDILAALVTNLLRADLMVILTVVDGLIDDRGEVLETVARIDGRIRSLARTQTSPLGSGGMASKLEAAHIVTEAGEAALIASGRQRDVLLRLMAGTRLGTLFLPATRKLTSRQRWIGLTVRPAGKLVIDEGAASALRRGGKSLLAGGILAVSGVFHRGDVVQVIDERRRMVARGLTNYSFEELDQIKGLRSSQFESVLGEKPYDEVIHRDNLVLAK